MKAKFFRIIAVLLLVVLLLVLGMTIAGAAAKSYLARKYPAPGQLVDVGGYKMHIYCIGEGSPTVILDAGGSEFSVNWAYVQPEVAKFTRICSYDRAGYGWSEPSPHPRTANTIVEELHTLLVNANIQGPYVMAGHSLGGLFVRIYAHNYPDEVAGLVLVDSSHEEQNIRRYAAIPNFEDLMSGYYKQAAGQFRMFELMRTAGIMALAQQSIPDPGLPDDALAQYRAMLATGSFFETSNAEQNAAEESFMETRALQITSFGNLPLIVLSAGLWEPNPDISYAEDQQSREIMWAVQSELALLSSEGKQIIADQSGHHIEYDQPDLVVEAIRKVVDTVRK